MTKSEYDDLYYGGKAMINSFRTRRQMLSGASAIIGTGLMGRTAYAGGGGGGGRDIEQPSQNISNDPPATKTPGQKIRVMFTQNKFHKVSPKGLKIAMKGIDAGHDYWIEGFSKKMSRNIFEMTLLDRELTLGMLKVMRKRKSEKERRIYLRDIEEHLEEEIRKIHYNILPQKLDDILFDDKKVQNDRYKEMRRQFKAYNRLLRRWIKKPMEGRLPVG